MTDKKDIAAKKLKDPANEFINEFLIRIPINTLFDFKILYEQIFELNKFKYEKNNALVDRQTITQKLGVDDMVQQFFVSSGYIEKIDNHYILTQRGLLAKELGGDKKFKKYRAAELNINNYQRKINYCLIFIAILSIISPFIMEYGKTKKWWLNEAESKTVLPIQNKIDVHVDTILLKSYIENKVLEHRDLKKY